MASLGESSGAGLDIVIPAYNEAANIGPVTRDALQALVDAGITGRLILVDDGSTDDTWHKMTSLARSAPNVVLAQHDVNKGLGAAIWTGIAEATMEWCAWLPSDGQIEARMITDMMQLTTDCDAVMVTRAKEQRPLRRRLASMAMLLVFKLFLGFNPTGFTGVFLLRTQTLREIPPVVGTGVQAYAVPIFCKNKGLRVGRIEMVWRPRLSGTSKVSNLRTVIKALYDTVKLRIAS